MTPSVFVFNPFAEGYIARGNAFTPVRHQALLAMDLANLPQFLGQSGDIVLLGKRPAAGFLNVLRQAGFPSPEFVELNQGRIDPGDSLCQQELGSLRPWAWGPDSVELFRPLFARVAGEARTADHYFNEHIARLYSKAWSAGFLREVLAHFRERHAAAVQAWLCSEEEAGVAVDTVEGALEAVAAIRRRGHHRVVVKEARGLAGHNAIRLWEPDILPAQQQWMSHALEGGQQLVVEPWLNRELDFSVQLEMEPRGLSLCGYTGLVNDLKGQFLANWAEADYSRRLPSGVAGFFQAHAGISRRLEEFYLELFPLLEVELRRAAYLGPAGIDALVYRTQEGDCRLKPVVEINPRYTMGRLTIELMKHTRSGGFGLFRLVSRMRARAQGFADLSGYAVSLSERMPLQLEGETVPRIRRGALCLNDPEQARVCLATFETGPVLNLAASLKDSSFPS